MQVTFEAAWVIHGDVTGRSLGFWDGTQFGPLGQATRYPGNNPPAEAFERAGASAWEARGDEGCGGVTGLIMMD